MCDNELAREQTLTHLDQLTDNPFLAPSPAHIFCPLLFLFDVLLPTARFQCCCPFRWATKSTREGNISTNYHSHYRTLCLCHYEGDSEVWHEILFAYRHTITTADAWCLYLNPSHKHFFAMHNRPFHSIPSFLFLVSVAPTCLSLFFGHL